MTEIRRGYGRRRESPLLLGVLLLLVAAGGARGPFSFAAPALSSLVVFFVVLPPVAEAYLTVRPPHSGHLGYPDSSLRYTTQPAIFGRELAEGRTYRANLFLPQNTDADGEEDRYMYLCSGNFDRTTDRRTLLGTEDEDESDGEGAQRWSVPEEEEERMHERILDGARVDGERYPSATSNGEGGERDKNGDDTDDDDSNGGDKPLPIALLVKRGRCSFDAKARAAQALNDRLREQALSSLAVSSLPPSIISSLDTSAMPRIEYLIVYDNDPTQGGRLVLMDGSKDGTVTSSLLFLSFASGTDLLRGMLSWEQYTGVSPRLNRFDFLPPDVYDALMNVTMGNPIDHPFSSRMAGRGGDGDDAGDGERPTTWYFPVEMDADDPYSDYHRRRGFFFGKGDLAWVRHLLLALLVGVPLLRVMYRWYRAGGRIYLWRRERDIESGEESIVWGWHVVRPYDGWRRGVLPWTGGGAGSGGEGGGGGLFEMGSRRRRKLMEWQVMALPEIVYEGNGNDDDEGDGNNEPKDTADVPGFNEDTERAAAMAASNESSSTVMNTSGNTTVAGSSSTSSSTAAASSATTVTSALTSTTTTTTVATRTARAGAKATTTCTSCSICIDEFERGEKLRLLPRCRHAFHTECILPWLTERSAECPLCKRSVLGENGSVLSDSDNEEEAPEREEARVEEVRVVVEDRNSGPVTASAAGSTSGEAGSAGREDNDNSSDSGDDRLVENRDSGAVAASTSGNISCEAGSANREDNLNSNYSGDGGSGDGSSDDSGDGGAGESNSSAVDSGGTGGEGSGIDGSSCDGRSGDGGSCGGSPGDGNPGEGISSEVNSSDVSSSDRSPDNRDGLAALDGLEDGDDAGTANEHDNGRNGSASHQASRHCVPLTPTLVQAPSAPNQKEEEEEFRDEEGV